MTLHRFNGRITLLSPLSHNSEETLSTDTLFRRQRIRFGDKEIPIPFYSGNAYRGIFRRIGAKRFLDMLGLGDRSITDKFYYLLFSGGALERGGKYIEVGLQRELREHIPLLSLVGTAVGNQMIQGKMDVGISWPIARETTQYTGVESDLTVFRLLDRIPYTRRDDREDKEQLRQDGAKKDRKKGRCTSPRKSAPQQMIYSIECLIPGTVLSHEFVLRNVTDLELSCFGAVIRAFESCPILGGKSGIGHGKVRLDYEQDWPDSKEYETHIKENKAAALEFIDTTLKGRV